MALIELKKGVRGILILGWDLDSRMMEALICELSRDIPQHPLQRQGLPPLLRARLADTLGLHAENQNHKKSSDENKNHKKRSDENLDCCSHALKCVTLHTCSVSWHARKKHACTRLGGATPSLKLQQLVATMRQDKRHHTC